MAKTRTFGVLQFTCYLWFLLLSSKHCLAVNLEFDTWLNTTNFNNNLLKKTLAKLSNESSFLESSTNPKCLSELNELQKGIDQHELWAIKFIDSWAKFPAGLFYGHLSEFGHFEECTQINKFRIDLDGHIKGKYCLSDIPFNNLISEEHQPINLQIGVCFPSTCNSQQINIFYKRFLELSFNFKLDNQTTLIREDSCEMKETNVFTPLDWFAIVFLIFLGVCMALSTLYDYRMGSWKGASHSLLIAFSLKTNLPQLLRINYDTSNPNVISCLHGIRSMAIIWIIFGHCYMWFFLMPVLNSIDIIDWLQNPYSMLMQSGNITVDTFFFLSGLLLIMVTMRQMDKTSGSLNIGKMYLHRYIRLTPVLALAVLLYMTLFRYMGSGPLWNKMTGAYKYCESSWWATLLYVQNYAAAGEMCLGHAWYLAVDFQLYIISPIILLTVWKWKKRALAGLAIFGTLLVVCLFTMIIVNNYIIFQKSGNLGADNAFMRQTYYATHARTSPWIIGIIFGYYLYTRKGRRATLSPFLVLIGWVVSLGLIFACLFALYPKTQPQASEITPLEGAFYLSLSRVAWPLALCWIVFACMNGYGGPINQLLSCPLWQPISKISYSMYIFHLLVENITAARLTYVPQFSNYDVILRFWGDFGITILVSVVMYLAIEAPMIGIEKFLFSSHISQNSNKKNIENTPTSISQQNLCD